MGLLCRKGRSYGCWRGVFIIIPNLGGNHYLSLIRYPNISSRRWCLLEDAVTSTGILSSPCVRGGVAVVRHRRSSMACVVRVSFLRVSERARGFKPPPARWWETGSLWRFVRRKRSTCGRWETRAPGSRVVQPGTRGHRHPGTQSNRWLPINRPGCWRIQSVGEGNLFLVIDMGRCIYSYIYSTRIYGLRHCII